MQNKNDIEQIATKLGFEFIILKSYLLAHLLMSIHSLSQ